jgi:hypothetical protein
MLTDCMTVQTNTACMSFFLVFWCVFSLVVYYFMEDLLEDLNWEVQIGRNLYFSLICSDMNFWCLITFQKASVPNTKLSKTFLNSRRKKKHLWMLHNSQWIALLTSWHGPFIASTILVPGHWDGKFIWKYSKGGNDLEVNSNFQYLNLSFSSEVCDFSHTHTQPKLWVKRQIDESRAWIDNENRSRR